MVDDGSGVMLPSGVEEVVSYTIIVHKYVSPYLFFHIVMSIKCTDCMRIV